MPESRETIKRCLYDDGRIVEDRLDVEGRWPTSYPADPRGYGTVLLGKPRDDYRCHWLPQWSAAACRPLSLVRDGGAKLARNRHGWHP